MKRIRDYRNAAEVAEVLSVINPHGYTEDSLKAAADRQSDATVFFGTGGWYCTFYPIDDKEYTHDAVFTIMPYAVQCYIIAQQQKETAEYPSDS